MTSTTFILGDDVGESVGTTPLQVRVTLTEVVISGHIAVQVTLDALPGAAQADLRGFFFDISTNSLWSSLTATGTDVTVFDHDGSVNNLGGGANINGIGPASYEIGVGLGTAGASSDFIDHTTFVLNVSGSDFGLSELIGQNIAIRATSVDDPNTTGNDGGSSKLIGTVPPGDNGGPDPQAGLSIDKLTADLGDDSTVDGTPSDGITVQAGENIQWQYTVTNTGNVDLTNVVVHDDGGTPDDESDDFDVVVGNLAAGASATVTHNGIAKAGDYANSASVSGHSVVLGDVLGGSDDSSYFGLNPELTLDKVTADGTSEGDGNSILAGEAITWKYHVVNTGNVVLTNIVVVDDSGTAGDTSDDVTVGTIASLAAGASADLILAGTAQAGSYANNATASADAVTDTAGHSRTAHDDDDSSYVGLNPELTLDKVTADGTSEGDGNSILAGEAITWKYHVVNTGNVALTNIVVVDDSGTAGDTSDDVTVGTIASLAAGASADLTLAGTAQAGSYANNATASADAVTDTAGHSRTAHDDDGSSYVGLNPHLTLVKETAGYVDPTHTATGDGLSFLAGYGVTWKYHVTNDGNVVLTDIVVVDDNGTAGVTTDDVIVGTIASLGVGASVDLSLAGIAKLGGYSNNATATADPVADTAGHSRTADDSDDSSYTGTFIEAGMAWTKGFWGQHLEAWDGKVLLNKQGKVDTQNLVDSHVLARTDMFSGGGVDSDGDGNINGGVYGVLLGDANGNFKTDGGEDTLFVSLTAAQQLISSADSANDTRQILMSQALATQLNIYNGAGEPNDLIREAVMWLKGEAPYQYTDGSTGKADANANGVLDIGTEYSTSTKALLSDANGTRSGTALTSNLQAWQSKVDVKVNTVGTQDANGEGLKNALMYFNDGHLVVSSSNQVGWDVDGLGGGTAIVGININSLDQFWNTLSGHATGVV